MTTTTATATSKDDSLAATFAGLDTAQQEEVLANLGEEGAKAVMPLYRDAQGTKPNILPGLLGVLATIYGWKVTPEDFLGYVYGVLAQPAFTDRYAKELGTRELRLPITKDAALFVQVRDIGVRLLWLHTYGRRFVPKGRHLGQVPKGKARCTRPVPGDATNYPEKYEYDNATKTLHVGDGEFTPVAPDVYGFKVSGLKVVQSWLRYRMKKGAGRKSSPLDDIRPEGWTSDFTTELLELLWVLEATLGEYPIQAKLLSSVVNGPYFRIDELPAVPESARKAPTCSKDATQKNTVSPLITWISDSVLRNPQPPNTTPDFVNDL